MKGIVFTELYEMVEERFGIELLNKVIKESSLKSGGVYSSVGTYDFSELLSLVTNLSKNLNVPAEDLIHAYGQYFFKVLNENYPQFFEHDNCFNFFKSIDSHIHVEVKKLYPDSELPRFFHKERENVLELVYSSERKLYKFARGLIEKSIEYFKENIKIEEEHLQGNGSEVKFTLTKLGV